MSVQASLAEPGEAVSAKLLPACKSLVRLLRFVGGHPELPQELAPGEAKALKAVLRAALAVLRDPPAAAAQHADARSKLQTALVEAGERADAYLQAVHALPVGFFERHGGTVDVMPFVRKLHSFKHWLRARWPALDPMQGGAWAAHLEHDQQRAFRGALCRLTGVPEGWWRLNAFCSGLQAHGYLGPLSDLLEREVTHGELRAVHKPFLGHLLGLNAPRDGAALLAQEFERIARWTRKATPAAPTPTPAPASAPSSADQAGQRQGTRTEAAGGRANPTRASNIVPAVAALWSGLPARYKPWTLGAAVMAGVGLAAWAGMALWSQVSRPLGPDGRDWLMVMRDSNFQMAIEPTSLQLAGETLSYTFTFSDRDAQSSVVERLSLDCRTGLQRLESAQLYRNARFEGAYFPVIRKEQLAGLRPMTIRFDASDDLSRRLDRACRGQG